MRGLALAQMKLGKHLEEGIGVSSDPINAYVWYVLSARGFLDARRERDRLAGELSVAQKQDANNRLKQIERQVEHLTKEFFQIKERLVESSCP